MPYLGRHESALSPICSHWSRPSSHPTPVLDPRDHTGTGPRSSGAFSRPTKSMTVLGRASTTSPPSQARSIVRSVAPPPKLLPTGRLPCPYPKVRRGTILPIAMYPQLLKCAPVPTPYAGHAVLYIYMYPLLAVFKMSAQSIQVLYAYEFTCIWRRRHNSWVTHNCLSHNRRMSIVQTSREDKEKGLWRQQISLSLVQRRCQLLSWGSS